MNSLYANMERWSPHVLSILRIVAALLFLEHGLSKVIGFPTPGPPLHGLLILAAILETVGSVLLLAGVALAAMASSFIGIVAYVSEDRQLRDLTFWSMGSLGGANWVKVAALAPVTAILVAAAPFLSRGLNALALGEAEAFHLGVRLQRLKAAIVFLVAMTVGASVAAAGVISFVGIVAPHAVRLVVRPDHRALLPPSVAVGAILLAGADVLARTLVSPAEMPIGVLTAAIGAPFFLWLLMRRGEGFGV